LRIPPQLFHSWYLVAANSPVPERRQPLLQQPEQFFLGTTSFNLSTFLVSAHAMRRPTVQLGAASAIGHKLLPAVATLLFPMFRSDIHDCNFNRNE
jgi:hypothetical protein